MVLLLVACGCREENISSRKPWQYILQSEGVSKERAKVVEVLSLSGAPYVVLDQMAGGVNAGPWTPLELQKIRAAAKGCKVLCYLSIGEAEPYRSYWQESWLKSPPEFLAEENPEWQGSYKVKYWLKAWQEKIFPRVDEIMGQGFDGLYLDIVDAFEYFEDFDKKNGLQPQCDYRLEMVNWIRRLRERCILKNRAALIFPQNGEGILEHPEVLSLIDGWAVESLWSDGQKMQSPESLAWRWRCLQPLRDKGLPLLIVEYPKKKDLAKQLMTIIKDYNIFPSMAERSLKGMCYLPQ